MCFAFVSHFVSRQTALRNHCFVDALPHRWGTFDFHRCEVCWFLFRRVEALKCGTRTLKKKNDHTNCDNLHSGSFWCQMCKINYQFAVGVADTVLIEGATALMATARSFHSKAPSMSPLVKDGSS